MKKGRRRAAKIEAAKINFRRYELDSKELQRLLDGPVAEAAHTLILEHGVCAQSDASGNWPLQESVEGLLERDYEALLMKAYDKHGGLPDQDAPDTRTADQIRALRDEQDGLGFEQLESSILAAYVLGIAVGQQVGQLAVKIGKVR